MIWPILEARAGIQKHFRSFFGSNEDIQKSFWNYLTLSYYIGSAPSLGSCHGWLWNIMGASTRYPTRLLSGILWPQQHSTTLLHSEAFLPRKWVVSLLYLFEIFCFYFSHFVWELIPCTQGSKKMQLRFSKDFVKSNHG